LVAFEVVSFSVKALNGEPPVPSQVAAPPANADPEAPKPVAGAVVLVAVDPNPPVVPPNPVPVDEAPNPVAGLAAPKSPPLVFVFAFAFAPKPVPVADDPNPVLVPPKPVLAGVPEAPPKIEPPVVLLEAPNPVVGRF
jgi:hypothetical protein